MISKSLKQVICVNTQDDSFVQCVTPNLVASYQQMQTFGESQKTLIGHHKEVYGISWNRDGNLLASSSGNETIKIWDINTGNCLKTLRSKRPFEGMNITGVSGITEATLVSLQKLGAVTQPFSGSQKAKY